MGRAISARVNIGRSICRQDRTLLRLELVLVMIVMVSPLWVMPLSSPVVSDVVVVMHHDSAVSTAVRTITANVPDVRVVEYGSPEYALMIHRVLGRVVWVSHGSDKGILAQSHVLSWKTFSSRIEMTPGKDIVLACDSAAIYRYVDDRSAIGFTGAIDATLGGLVTTYLLAPSENVLTMMYEQMVVLLGGEATPSRLLGYVIGHLGSNELFWACVGVAFLVVSLLAGYGMGWALEKATVRAIGLMLSLGYLTIFTNIVVMCIGWLSGEVSLLAFIASLIPIVLILIYYIIISVALYELWKVGVLGSSASAPWVTMISNIALVLTVVVLLLGILSDFTDSDDQATTFFG